MRSCTRTGENGKSAEIASEVHRARHVAACNGTEPQPLSAPGCLNLFAPARPGRAEDPYEADDAKRNNQKDD